MTFFKAEICLERQNGVFYCGETIIGKLNFNIKQRVKINSIKLFINGYAECDWWESGRIIKKIGGFELYLKSFIHFLPKEEYGDEIYLEPGDYSYDFQVLIPSNLPTSFFHLNGRIIYNLTAIFDRPWSINKTIEKYLTIIRLYDLNKTLTDLDTDIYLEKQKSYGCFCCKTLPVKGILSLFKKGFAIGEDIPFKVEINNESSRYIKSLRVVLRQKLKLIAQKKKKKSIIKDICSLDKHVLIHPSSNYVWDGEKINVPFINPSNMGTIIQITYSVCLIVKSSFLTKNLIIEAPIEVGLVAINDNKPKFEIEALNKNPFKNNFK